MGDPFQSDSSAFSVWWKLLLICDILYLTAFVLFINQYVASNVFTVTVANDWTALLIYNTTTPYGPPVFTNNSVDFSFSWSCWRFNMSGTNLTSDESTSACYKSSAWSEQSSFFLGNDTATTDSMYDWIEPTKQITIYQIALYFVCSSMLIPVCCACGWTELVGFVRASSSRHVTSVIGAVALLLMGTGSCICYTAVTVLTLTSYHSVHVRPQVVYSLYEVASSSETRQMSASNMRELVAAPVCSWLAWLILVAFLVSWAYQMRKSSQQASEVAVSAAGLNDARSEGSFGNIGIRGIVMRV